MNMEQLPLESNMIKIILDGALDIAGAGDIDLPFSIISGKYDKVMVDFTKVSFLASIGIRVLVKAAKTIGNRGGRMVVINPNDASRKVLQSTGVNSIIPIVDSEAAAIVALN